MQQVHSKWCTLCDIYTSAHAIAYTLSFWKLCKWMIKRCLLCIHAGHKQREILCTAPYRPHESCKIVVTLHTNTHASHTSHRWHMTCLYERVVRAPQSRKRDSTRPQTTSAFPCASAFVVQIDRAHYIIQFWKCEMCAQVLIKFYTAPTLSFGAQCSHCGLRVGCSLSFIAAIRSGRFAEHPRGDV